ncbi:hypothetical protein EV361DRAFT_944008 [Lentinula raphanica]|uniref:Phosphatidylglycerol/phosphatidylinositol transfer protein n=1 Tax=Lentinula raphanica TaxID=153919 RepID=A0AA38PL26_9AGAR|nr:hypothetical protein F5878DRAFT_3325 [Lentinula raphanica]KAJ3977917.1 hypothetical protein EV361DRAFT_944008 [Lentinula raphanica]
MKSYITLLALASIAVAQSAQIGTPQQGTSVVAGSNVTVMIEKPNSLTSTQEVAIVIGLASCGNAPCPNTTSKLGEILYQGSFNPQYSSPPGALPPHQNYSLQVPASFAAGQAILGVAHLSLVGAAMAPTLETFNTTLMVTNAESSTDSTAARRSMRILGYRALRNLE